MLDKYYNTKITSTILRHDIFSDLEYLDISDNQNIKDINHLKNLKSLVCRGEKSALCQNGIRKLKLEELYCYGNKHIYDISFMKNTLRRIEPNDNIRLELRNDKICGRSKPCMIVFLLIIALLFVVLCMILASAYYGYLKRTSNKDNNSMKIYTENNVVLCNVGRLFSMENIVTETNNLESTNHTHSILPIFSPEIRYYICGIDGMTRSSGHRYSFLNTIIIASSMFFLLLMLIVSATSLFVVYYMDENALFLASHEQC